MNGPEHYREAERLLAEATEMSGDWQDTYAARAQAHATLALVAATANTPDGFSGDRLADLPSAWDGDHSGDGPTWQSVTA